MDGMGLIQPCLNMIFAFFCLKHWFLLGIYQKDSILMMDPWDDFDIFTYMNGWFYGFHVGIPVPWILRDSNNLRFEKPTKKLITFSGVRPWRLTWNMPSWCHRGFVQIIFLSFHLVICTFQPLIFQGFIVHLSMPPPSTSRLPRIMFWRDSCSALPRFRKSEMSRDRVLGKDPCQIFPKCLAKNGDLPMKAGERSP